MREKMKEQREPFAEFAKLGRGIPRLAWRENPKTMHVHWGDGTMRDYSKFVSALDSKSMIKDLHDIFQRHATEGKITSRRTVLSYGGVHGAVTYAPHALATEVRTTVLDYFTCALKIVGNKLPEAA